MTKRIFTLFFLLALGISVPAQNIETHAGGGPNNMPATSANLNNTFGVAFDGAGNLYIVAQSSHRIFKVDAGTGVLTVIAGNGTSGSAGDGGPATRACLSNPVALTLGSGGNVYIADQANQRIRKVDAATGVISTVAGNGTLGFSGDGGPATSASLRNPAGVAFDAGGNLYIADQSNHRIRKVTSGGIISTVAGNGTQGFSGDGGPATSARLNNSIGVAFDAGGNLLIADTFNERVRKVDATTGFISTIAGNGVSTFAGDGGPATSASLRNPAGLAFDAGGNLYIADVNNQRIRKVSTGGNISTVAGNGVASFSGDGGPATSARLNGPRGVAVDAGGNFYVADSSNNRIRKVDAGGTISTFAGNGGIGFSGDAGPAANAGLFNPFEIAFDAGGSLYIADQFNSRIRRVTLGGAISTYAGNGAGTFSGDGGPATIASLRNPTGVTFDAGGNLYITDQANQRIRKVNAATGIISTVVGSTQGFSGDGGPATSARLSNPQGAALDAAGNLYIADMSNQRIRKVTSGGIISTFAGNGLGTFSGDGGPADSASVSNPAGVAVDASGNLYIADQGNQRIRKVTVATGVISTVAGNGAFGFSGDGGPALGASFRNPTGVAFDVVGNLYIADQANQRIRKITAATGIISTVAGNGTLGFSGDGGPATSANLANPQGIGVDPSGNFYFADRSNHRIRRIVLTPPDADADGLADTADNCPLIPNADQADFDGDGQGDACDADDDNDTVADATDNCSLIANTDQSNTDGDSQGNACDADDDNDGIADGVDNCSLDSNADQLDTDADGQGDACDTDDDNDTVADGADNCPLASNTDQLDTDADGQGDVCDSDDDNDGVADPADNCQLVSNANQLDTDGDGQGDTCDSDDDNDGVADTVDNCSLTINSNQANNDNDAEGDVCDADDDNDTVADVSDNCQFTANTDQTDTDADGQGNVCDSDDDNDGVTDTADNCSLTPNTDQANNDGDAQGDVCDPDDDNDTVPDTADNCHFAANTDQADTDADGQGDVCDADDDNDGVLDSADNCPLTPNPDQRDTDGDGVGDACDTNGMYRICALYDQNKLHKSGSVVPIKLQLCDANGINQSSPSNTVTAIGVMKVSDTAFGTAEDSGNSNPDSNFRFSVDQYQFNLKTTGLTTGTYLLGFRVGPETFIYTVQFKVK